MGYLYHINNKLFVDAQNRLFHEQRYSPPIFEFPTEIQTSVVTGDTTSNFVPKIDESFPGFPCGIFVVPDESRIYIKAQSYRNFYIFANTGTLIRESEPIPNYTGFSTGSHAGKIYLMNNKQYLLSGYDTKTMVKHDLAGNYISHYTVNQETFRMSDFAEDPATGNIFISSRDSVGIEVCDANFNYISHLPMPNFDILGMTIINNLLYIGIYMGLTSGIVKMNLDGTNQVRIVANTDFTSLRPSADGSGLFGLTYGGTLYKYNLADTLEWVKSATPYGGLAIYVNPWGTAVYAVGSYNSDYFTIKIS